MWLTQLAGDVPQQLIMGVFNGFGLGVLVPSAYPVMDGVRREHYWVDSPFLDRAAARVSPAAFRVKADSAEVSCHATALISKGGQTVEAGGTRHFQRSHRTHETARQRNNVSVTQLSTGCVHQESSPLEEIDGLS